MGFHLWELLFLLLQLAVRSLFWAGVLFQQFRSFVRAVLCIVLDDMTNPENKTKKR